MPKRVIETSDAPRAIGPYSQAIVAGGFVYVSGQVPIDHITGTIVQSDIKNQVRVILENTKAILAAAGCTLDSVVKTTIYLKNMSDFSDVNEIYGGYFASAPPARATTEVSRLPKDVSIEMDFIAWKE